MAAQNHVYWRRWLLMFATSRIGYYSVWKKSATTQTLMFSGKLTVIEINQLEWHVSWLDFVTESINTNTLHCYCCCHRLYAHKRKRLELQYTLCSRIDIVATNFWAGWFLQANYPFTHVEWMGGFSTIDPVATNLWDGWFCKQTIPLPMFGGWVVSTIDTVVINLLDGWFSKEAVPLPMLSGWVVFNNPSRTPNPWMVICTNLQYPER